MRMCVNPCLACGACCAFYRASFYWMEADVFTPGGAPEELTQKLNDFRLVMKGTNGSVPRCIALNGIVGRQVTCSIYERRSSVCRDFEPSWQNNSCNPDCDKARRAWGLEPMTPEFWFDDWNFPQAA